MRTGTRKIAAGAALALALAAIGVYVEHRWHEGERSVLTTAAEAATADFRPAPIRPDWILNGAPVTEAAEIAHTHDRAAGVYVWRTTAATFRWVHEADEIVTILDGEVYITEANGRVRHLKPGDVALFPAGAAQTWRVPERVTKSVVLKPRMPVAIEVALRWLRRGRGLLASADRDPG